MVLKDHHYKCKNEKEQCRARKPSDPTSCPALSRATAVSHAPVWNPRREYSRALQKTSQIWERDQGGTARNRCRKIKAYRYKRVWLSVNSGLVSRFVWPCSALISNMHPVFLLNFISICFPRWELSVVCACMHMEV